MEWIQQGPKLPSSFYKILSDYYPNKFKYGFWSSAFLALFGQEYVRCECRVVGFNSIFNTNGYYKKSRYAAAIIALEIEDYFSQQECFEYYMSVASFGNGIWGIREAAREYFNKSIEELDDREIISLIVIENATTYYNPLRNPTNLRKAVDKILSKNWA